MYSSALPYLLHLLTVRPADSVSVWVIASGSLTPERRASAATVSEPGGTRFDNEGHSDPVTKSDIEDLLNKQHDSFKADIVILIQQSTESLKQSVDLLGQQVTAFNSRLTKTEVLVGENFDKLTEMDAAVKSLQSQATALLERVDDLENRSRRSNLRIVNIPEGSERDQDPTKFASDLLMAVTGPDVFSRPPEIERAHRS